MTQKAAYKEVWPKNFKNNTLNDDDFPKIKNPVPPKESISTGRNHHFSFLEKKDANEFILELGKTEFDKLSFA